MLYFRIPDPEGGPDRFAKVSEAEGVPSAKDMGIDLAVAHEVPRMPQDGERWSPTAEAFVLEIDAELHAAIDASAGVFRGRYITTIPGQDSAYRRKEAEARDLVGDGVGPWPMLEAEAGATGAELLELAAQIITLADAWAELEPKIEGARVGAKRAVTGAETASAKRAAAAIDWDALVDRDKAVTPLGSKAQGVEAGER